MIYSFIIILLYLLICLELAHYPNIFIDQEKVVINMGMRLRRVKGVFVGIIGTNKPNVFQIILCPVVVSGLRFDYICVPVDKEMLRFLKIGNVLSFLTHASVHWHKDWCYLLGTEPVAWDIIG